MKYLIIGNSAAGIATAESIRTIDSEGQIVIVSEEKHHTYSRPLISYLLLGKTDKNRMKYREDEFYVRNSILLLSGRKVVSLNPDKKEVKLDDGQILSYDKCMVATGSVPFVPPTEGIDTVKSKFGFMKLDDALALQESVNADSKVFIIGAGLIGLKCAEGIAHLCKEITIVDMAPRILSSVLDEEGAAVIQKHLEEHHMKFILSDCVQKFDKNKAILKSGKEIMFDILVMAVGVKPNVELVKNAGGTVNRGIVVDEFMRTSLKDVYSAGDCSEGYDSSIGQNRVLALLPNAVWQGKCAGYHMAVSSDSNNKAEEKPYTEGIPMNSIGFFGYHIATCGSYEGDCYVQKSEDGSLKKLFYKDNTLKGYIVMGNIQRVGIYTQMIRKKIPLSSIDFEQICIEPGLMPFSHKEREEMLSIPR